MTSHHEAIKIINDLIKNNYVYKKQTLKNSYSFEPIKIFNTDETNIVHPIILFSNIGQPTTLNPLRNIRIVRMKEFILSEILRGKLWAYHSQGYYKAQKAENKTKFNTINWFCNTFFDESVSSTEEFLDKSGAKLTLHEVREKFFGRQTLTFTQLEKRDPKMKHLAYLTAKEEMTMLNSYIEHSLIFDYLTPDDIRLKRLQNKNLHWSKVLTREELEQNNFIKYEHLIDRFYRAKTISDIVHSIIKKFLTFNYRYFSREYVIQDN